MGTLAVPASAGATALMFTEHGPVLKSAHGYNTARYIGAQYERKIVEVGGSWSGIPWEGIADSFVNGAIENGFQPYLTLTASPDPAKWPYGGRVPSVGVFQSVCKEMAQRYNGQVLHYSVWNEPNLEHVGGLSPSTYTALYNACRGAIKEVSPGASVYFGEFSTSPSGWNGLNACQYFRMAAPVGSDIRTEGVAIHPYQFTTDPASKLPTECRGIGRLSDWEADLVNAKNNNAVKTPAGGVAPVIISEFGYCTDRSPATYNANAAKAACPQTASGQASIIPESWRAEWIAWAFQIAQAHQIPIFNLHTLYKRDPGEYNGNPNTYLWETGIIQAGSDAWTASVPALRNAVNPSFNGKPEAHTDSATNVTIGKATLKGAVDPNNLVTQYRFEYGPTPSLGSSTPLVEVGWKKGTYIANATITNLTPGTTYYFRIVGYNGAGTTTGYTQSFTTKRKTDSDVNGDGMAELVTLASWKTAYAYQGQGNLEFGPAAESFAGTMDPALYDGVGHYLIDVTDVAGDGYADLVTLMSDGTACVYQGQENRSFSSSCIPSFNKTMAPGLRAPGGHEPIGVADVTGDGRGDLVTFYHPLGEVFVYKGEANNTFGGGVSSFAGAMNSALFDRSGHYFIDVADVTGDGRADLTTVTSGGYGAVYEGQSNGTFTGPKLSFAATLQVGFIGTVGHEPIGVADVTGDNRADLVTFYSPTGETYTYPGNASGYFGAGVATFTGGTLNSNLFDKTGWELATLLDVNGDTHADLVTSVGGGVRVYGGTQSGMFGTGVQSFGSSFDSSRFDGVGHEFAMEKPSFRRRGCFNPNGCFVP